MTMKQERNKEAASVSPVVSISSKYEIQSYNANYACNLHASSHQIPDVGSVQYLSRLSNVCVYMMQT